MPPSNVTLYAQWSESPTSIPEIHGPSYIKEIRNNSGDNVSLNLGSGVHLQVGSIYNSDSKGTGNISIVPLDDGCTCYIGSVQGDANSGSITLSSLLGSDISWQPNAEQITLSTTYYYSDAGWTYKVKTNINPPENPVNGTFWYSNSESKLKVYFGGSWHYVIATAEE